MFHNVPRGFTYQSILAAPSPLPAGFLRGICQSCQSGKALANWVLPRGRALPAWDHPRTLDMPVISYQNITTQRILLEKQADWLICQGREKIVKG